jgi:hypothetical protein
LVKYTYGLTSIEQHHKIEKRREGGGVSHYGLAIYIKKHRKAKEELWKLKYFTMQNIIFKQSSKRIQNPSKYFDSVTNLKFQHEPKYQKCFHPALCSEMEYD